ncbi:hypothetical protein [Helicobacter pylori]|uniref:hypothetical protein n=1 Tax=Helicobacter pylori TaxID=210 RepID=UPI00165CAC8E|nr:hypothetical protein [Helicobacter pylori]
MRHEHETAASFKELQEITQAIQALKKGAPKNATNQQSARTQTSENANAGDFTQQSALKPKATAHAKKGRLNPTKKAFSERQKTTLKKGLQESANEALKTEQGKNSNSQAEPSDEAFKPGLATHQSNQKGGKNEA